MRLKHVSRTQFTFDDGTAWPRPDALTATFELDARRMELVLRHYAGAFVALVWQPKRRRDQVIRALRAAAKAQEKRAATPEGRG